MPNGNEGDLYREILSKLKGKLEKAMRDRAMLRKFETPWPENYEWYCNGLKEAIHHIEAYEEEAMALVQYYDGETGKWLPGAPQKYRWK